MMLTEQEAVPVEALPLAIFRDHLKLGRGFDLDTGQDQLVESYLRAALAAIEGRIGKALIARRFLWQAASWRGGAEVALPLAPVRAVISVSLMPGTGGAAVLVESGRYRLVPDGQRPKIAAIGGALPVPGAGGWAEVVFEAGFGPDWADLPVDLQQAVLLLAAEYFEMRHEGGGSEGVLPFGVMALIERWRTVRVLGGGAA